MSTQKRRKNPYARVLVLCQVPLENIMRVFNANVSPILISQTKLKLISNKLLKRSTSAECPISKMIFRNRVKGHFYESLQLFFQDQKKNCFLSYFLLLLTVNLVFWKVLPFWNSLVKIYFLFRDIYLGGWILFLYLAPLYNIVVRQRLQLTQGLHFK